MPAVVQMLVSLLFVCEDVELSVKNSNLTTPHVPYSAESSEKRRDSYIPFGRKLVEEVASKRVFHLCLRELRETS